MASPEPRVLPPSPLRRARLGAIHKAKKNLAMDDDVYRKMLVRITGLDSAAKCSTNQLGLVMDELKQLGAVFGSASNRPRSPQAPPEKAPLLSKIDALLLNATPVRDRAYADGLAKRMFKIERVEFCTPVQLRKVVAALEYDKKRHGGPKA